MTLLTPVRPAATAMKPARPVPAPSLPVKGQKNDAPPLLAACDFVPQGDGSYRAIPRKPQDKLPAREAARLANYSLTHMYRLYRAGFITGERTSPRRILIDVPSLQAHLKAVRDPEFWTPERKLQYGGV